MTNSRQSEILFLDVKTKNTPIIQVFYLIKMKDIASKNSSSNRPRYVLIYTPLIHWRPGDTELYVLNSITTIAILSQQYHNYRNSITTIAILSQQYHSYRNSIAIVSQLSQQYFQLSQYYHNSSQSPQQSPLLSYTAYCIVQYCRRAHWKYKDNKLIEISLLSLAPRGIVPRATLMMKKGLMRTVMDLRGARLVLTY